MEAMVVAIDWVIVAIEDTVAAIQEFAAWFDEHLMPIIQPIIDQVVDAFEYLWEQIQNVVDLVVALFEGDFGGAWDALKEMATTAIDFVVDTFGDLPGLMLDAAIAGVGLLADLGKAFGKALVNGLISVWNMADLRFPRIDVPSWVPGVGGKGFGGFDVFPDIPTLAAGGIIQSPQLVLAGEAGPEAIIPLDRAGGGFGGMAAPTVNVTVQGSVISEYELADVIQSQLIRSRRRNYDLEFE